MFQQPMPILLYWRMKNRLYLEEEKEFKDSIQNFEGQKKEDEEQGVANNSNYGAIDVDPKQVKEKETNAGKETNASNKRCLRDGHQQ